jgi:hypothetical protein
VNRESGGVPFPGGMFFTGTRKKRENRNRFQLSVIRYWLIGRQTETPSIEESIPSGAENVLKNPMTCRRRKGTFRVFDCSAARHG